MKKTFIAIICVLAAAVIAFASAIAVRLNESSTFPKGGIRFAKQNSSLCFSSSESVRITLISFEIKKGDYRSLLSYNDIYLIDEKGNEYVPSDGSIAIVFDDIYFSRKSITLTFSQEEFGDVDETVITKAKLVANDGKNSTFRLGRIALMRVSENEKLNGISITGSSETLHSLNSYRIQVTNNTDESIVITDMVLNLTGYEYELFAYSADGKKSAFNNEYKLGAGEFVFLSAEFEQNDSWLLTYLKAKINFKTDKDCSTASYTTAAYMTMMDRELTKKYLTEGCYTNE